MIAPFSVMDERFQKYLVNFHIAREAFRRMRLPRQEGEPIPLPPEEVMEILVQGRDFRLPSQALQDEANYNKRNLDALVRIALDDFLGRGIPAQIRTGHGMHDAVYYEDRNIIAYDRIKKDDEYWRKSMLSVNSQHETGHFDHKGIRLIVESPKAREYRTQRKYKNLGRSEQKSFKKKFNGKVRVQDLTDEQRAEFIREFSREYSDLMDIEKQEYSEKFGSSHEKMCVDLAKRIAALKSIDTIPLTPHYMKADNLDLRVQRQVIIDHKGDIVLELEYILNRIPSTDDDFCGFVLGMVGHPQDSRGGAAQYIDRYGHTSHLMQYGNLLLNFHVVAPRGININSLASIIQNSYAEAQRKFSGEESPDTRDTKVMEAIRLGMDAIPIGLFIFPETLTKGVEQAYKGMALDVSRVYDMFIDDKTGKNRRKDTGFGNVKVCICSSLDSKQISGEIQIMDPIMHDHAEFGEGAEYIRDKERIKVARYSKPTAPISKEDEELGIAFMKQGPESDEAFARIFSEFYARSIDNLVMGITQLGAMPEGESSPDYQELVYFFDRINVCVVAAQERAGQSNIAQVVNAVNSVFDMYAAKKGTALVYFKDEAWAINEMLNKASKDFGIFLNFKGSRQSLDLDVHDRHAAILFNHYTRLAISDDVREVAASLIVARLIRKYNDFYNDGLTPKTQQRFRDLLTNFYLGKGWQECKIGSVQMGYVPGKFMVRSKIQSALHDPNILRMPYFRNFDVKTLAILNSVYESTPH